MRTGRIASPPSGPPAHPERPSGTRCRGPADPAPPGRRPGRCRAGRRAGAGGPPERGTPCRIGRPHRARRSPAACRTRGVARQRPPSPPRRRAGRPPGCRSERDRTGDARRPRPVPASAAAWTPRAPADPAPGRCPDTRWPRRRPAGRTGRPGSLARPGGRRAARPTSSCPETLDCRPGMRRPVSWSLLSVGTIDSGIEGCSKRSRCKAARRTGLSFNPARSLPRQSAEGYPGTVDAPAAVPARPGNRPCPPPAPAPRTAQGCGRDRTARPPRGR